MDQGGEGASGATFPKRLGTTALVTLESDDFGVSVNEVIYCGTSPIYRQTSMRGSFSVRRTPVIWMTLVLTLTRLHTHIHTFPLHYYLVSQSL